MTKSEQSTTVQTPENSAQSQALTSNMTEQLSMAGLVQRDFLPDHLPDSDQLRWAAAFFPAEWVSGDIYDVVRIDEQHIGFYIADVVGHGVPAALLTIFLKQALTMRQTFESSYRVFSPAEVMKNLNLRMTGQKLSGSQFITCCYCLLNIETLQLTYSRAGHPYPILFRDGEELQQLESKGPLLGIFEEAEFAQQTIQLQAGDKLLLYTDGLEPAIGSFDDTEGFQFDRSLVEVMDLPIGDIIEKITSRLAKMNIPPAEIDDLTAVGLEIL